MISPLGQRQVFQTAHVEAIRQASDVSEQIQREASKQKAAESHLVEEQSTVRLIPESEQILTEERKQERRRKHQAEAAEAAEESPEDHPAGSAESRLDFLA
jgi:hypothetical protein